MKELSKEEKLNLYESVITVLDLVSKGESIADVLDKIYEHFINLIPYSRIGFSLIKDVTRENDVIDHYVRAYWAKSKAPIFELTVGYENLLNEKSSLTKMLETKEPRIINDLEKYLDDHPNSDPTKKILAEGVLSNFTCPLVVNNRTVGFLFFSSQSKNIYKEVHITIFKLIASQISSLLEKSLLSTELARSNAIQNKFVGIANHDLKNPLAVIKGYLDTLEGGHIGEIDDSAKGIIKKIIKVCDSMENIINYFLDINKMQSDKIELNTERFDVTETIRETIDENINIAAKKNIKINMPSSIEAILLEADKFKIKQVLNNLISNAIKYSQKNKEINVNINRDIQKGYLNIIVSDNGQGISEDDIPKLFQEFCVTKTKPTSGEKSTGLGLSIVKKIVEAHHGRVEIKSKLGIGTTVTVVVPLNL